MYCCINAILIINYETNAKNCEENAIILCTFSSNLYVNLENLNFSISNPRVYHSFLFHFLSVFIERDNFKGRLQ